MAHSTELPLQIKRCKTDAFDGLEFGNEDRPECSNLLTLYQLATGQSKVSRLDCCSSRPAFPAA